MIVQRRFLYIPQAEQLTKANIIDKITDMGAVLDEQNAPVLPFEPTLTPAQRARGFRYFRGETWNDRLLDILEGNVDPYREERHHDYTSGPRRSGSRWLRRASDTPEIPAPDRRKSNIGRKYRES